MGPTLRGPSPSLRRVIEKDRIDLPPDRARGRHEAAECSASGVGPHRAHPPDVGPITLRLRRHALFAIMPVAFALPTLVAGCGAFDASDEHGDDSASPAREGFGEGEGESADATSEALGQGAAGEDTADTASVGGPVPLPSRAAHDFVDVRGVGDSAWATSHDHTPMSPGFGAAVHRFDPSGRFYRGDLSFMNWESVVGPYCATFATPRQTPVDFAFISDPRNLAQAYALGFDLIGLSNNHARDCTNSSPNGEAGELMTVREMSKMDGNAWIWNGVAKTEAERTHVKVRAFTIKGRAVRVAFGSIYYGKDDCGLAACRGDAPTVMHNLQHADADLRILAMHSVDAENQEEAARAGAEFVTKYGGDVVFGHGPHVWRPVRIYRKPNGRRGVVFESLGNFLHPGLAWKTTNFIGRALFAKNDLSLRQIQIIPIANEGTSVVLSATDPVAALPNLPWKRSAAIHGAYVDVRR